MHQKLKIICFDTILFFFTLGIFPLMAQNNISIGAVAGANFSRTISVPKSLYENGHSYSQEYMSGVNWAGLIKFTKKRITIGTGIGCKTLNFNFQRKHPYSYSYFETKYSSFPIQRTLAFVRLNYVYFPLKMQFSFDQKQIFFICSGIEYAMLVNDVNTENIQWPGTYLLTHEVHNWFKRNQLWIMVGAGIYMNSETTFNVEIGFTPTYVDKDVMNESGYFYFSKKLFEIRITLSYDFFKF